MKILCCIILFVGLCSAKPLSDIIDDEDRIVGGKPTSISVLPYQVSIRNRRVWQVEKDFTHSCGGSIYDDRIIITAAHCVIGKIPSQLKVVAGSDFKNGTSGIIIPVAEIIFHEDYNPSIIDNDAAILVLASPLPLNNFTMKPIELADREYPENSLATLSGWGTLKSKGSSPYQLMTVQVPLVNRANCQLDYGEDSSITEAMICGGYRGVGGKDTCQGDSGGPFVIDNKLVGIVSWGNGCAKPDFPGVYTNVLYFVSWFEETIADAKHRHNII